MSQDSVGSCRIFLLEMYLDILQVEGEFWFFQKKTRQKGFLKNFYQPLKRLYRILHPVLQKYPRRLYHMERYRVVPAPDEILISLFTCSGFTYVFIDYENSNFFKSSVSRGYIRTRTMGSPAPSTLRTNYASIFRGTRVFQPYSFLLDQPLCSLWHKMYVCHRTNHQRQKSMGLVTIIARRKDDNNYGQDRDEWHIYSYIGGTYA